MASARQEDKITLRSLAEVPKHLMPPKALDKDLTMLVVDVFGKVNPIPYYKEKSDCYLVPRQWAIQLAKSTNLGIEDETKEVETKWGELTFPTGTDYRAGQQEAIEKTHLQLLQKTHGLLLAKTGSGKCFMSMAIAAKLGQRTLVLVHKDNLLPGFTKVLTENKESPYIEGIQTGVLKDMTEDEIDSKQVVFSTFQYISRNLDKLYWLKDKFGFIVVDEGHHTPAKTFNQVFSLFSAKYRLLLSATFRRKDGLDKVWHLHVGGVLHELTSPRLTGKYVCYPTNCTVPLKSKFYGLDTVTMIGYIANHQHRNAIIAKEVIKAAEFGRRILVVSDRIIHLANIQNHFPPHIKERSAMYHSKADNPENLKQQIILSSFKMMEEGTDVPELDTLFITTPKGDLEQTVGRIQRPHPTKKSIMAVYFLDQNSWCLATWKKAKVSLEKVGMNE